jgi:predicted nucleic acid-binding Zn ribbon protein
MLHVKPVIRMGPELNLACSHCGKVVRLTRSDQQYCSRRCKEQAHKKRIYELKRDEGTAA